MNPKVIKMAIEKVKIGGGVAFIYVESIIKHLMMIQTNNSNIY